MPTPTTYIYSLSADCPGGIINTTKLHTAIVRSSIVTAPSNVSIEDDVLSISFKDALSDADRITLDNNTAGPAGGLIASTDNSPSSPLVQPIGFADINGDPIFTTTDADGKTPLFVQRKSGATKFNQFSPNWCDKTTWYQQSTKVTDETLTDSGDHTAFTSANEFWIDTKHGKIFNERLLSKNNSYKWVVSVTVDDVAKVECKPGQPGSGDYTVDYAAGHVIFNNSIGSGHTVKATYWYSPTWSGNSMWYIDPPANCRIELLRVEVQFSKDIVIKDTVVFQAFGWIDAYWPAGMQAPYNIPSHTLIPLGDPIEYKGVTDFVAESNGAQPIITAFGGDHEGGWRAIQQDIYTLVWDYVSRTDIAAGTGFCIGVCLETDTEFGGNYATSTFYNLQVPEN